MKDCKHCKKAGKNCIPGTLLMSRKEFHLWCKHRKEALHLTFEDIAQEANLPKRTVERIFADDHKDCLFENMRPIIRILSGCTEHQLDCDSVTDPDELLKERVMQSEKTIARMKEENERQRVQYRRNADFLKAELEHERKRYKTARMTFYIAAVLAFVELIIIIAALVIDRVNSGIGFFWLN